MKAGPQTAVVWCEVNIRMTLGSKAELKIHRNFYNRFILPSCISSAYFPFLA